MSYIQKPPTAGESGPIDVPALFDAIELPQQYHTAHFIRQHIVPAIASEFADGEITILHPPETEPAIREFFGDHEYSKGSFGRRFREITEGEDQSLRHHADSFIRFCANIVAKDVLEGGILPPPDPNVMVRKSGRAVLFDQKIVALNTDPRFVVDYGPGLQGRFHIEEQYATFRNTYQYAAFTKGTVRKRIPNGLLGTHDRSRSASTRTRRAVHWQGKRPRRCIGRSYFGACDYGQNRWHS